MKKFLSAFFALSLLAAPAAYAEHHENHGKDVDLTKEHGDHHKHEGHTHDTTHAHGDHTHKAADAVEKADESKGSSAKLDPNTPPATGDSHDEHGHKH